MEQLLRLGKRELICLLLFTCNYVVSVLRGFLFLWVLGMGYVILLWHPLLELLHVETITISRGYNVCGCKWSYFRMFEIRSFCFDVVMCDLVHDVRAIHGVS